MILLTGATGFVGSNLLKTLLARKYQLCCIKRSSSNDSRVLEFMDACIWYNIDEIDVESIFLNHPIETVIHCATDYGRDGADAVQVYQSNISFPLKLLDCAQRHGSRLFINTDSFFVRQADALWREGKEPYKAMYTRSKYIFTCVVKDQIKRRKISFVNLQLEHVYGPGDGKDKFVSFLLESLLCNREWLKLTSGDQMRDFIYVEDVANAYLAVLENIGEFERGIFYQFELGTGRATTLRAFIEKAKEVTGSVTRLEFGQKPMMEHEVMYSCADNHGLIQLGWRPQFSIAEGLEKLIHSMYLKKN